MIEPSNGQRGVIGEGHGLARLTSTLDALSQGQAQQRTRDTHLQEQLATLTQDMRMMMCWGKRLVGALGVLAVLTLALCGVGGWQMTHRPDMGYARALGTLDATLAQHLPKAHKRGQDFQKIVAGRKLWNFDKREWKVWQEAL